MDGCEEVSFGFVVSRGDGAVELEFGEEVFDQVSSFVEFFVIVSLDLAVGFGWNDCGLAGLFQGLEDALIGIEALVGEQRIGFDEWKQHVGSVQIAGLASREMNSGRIAQRVDGGVDLGAQPAFAASDGLIAPFLRAPALC